ncbi:cytochrome P450 [Planomonospora parontospora]|uniref:cytochrome P450 n=1 Tax=Planomonospora parontospora TaxID=58119 RepID=UPI001670F4F8|nr:cytochrome P450 [Planomonospora parontospora]GGL25560.1 cytochrome P450 [Planomonospora parontospora subsp. antibiotica]GII16323.1 cytochrome P450 [Planomonospora parontospora subsp. antibiotica]
MPIDVDTGPSRRVRSVPVRRALPRLVRDPVSALAEFAREAGGEVVRLHLGPFRPYLVTHPDHVQQVLRTEWTNYQRQGVFWKPLGRMLGSSILGEGEPWKSSRKALQPLFTSRYVAEIAGEMAATINERVGELAGYARGGRPIDAAREMKDIVNQAVVRVLFGDKISREDGERLAPAYDTAAGSIGLRLLMPFVPYSVRVPGDRAFMEAVRTVDDVVFPLIREARADPGDGTDVISALCRDRGKEVDDRQIRDDLVSVYGAASETTAMTLTWLWPLLDAHPEVAAKLRREIEDVVGAGPVAPAHVPGLGYTRMVLQELMRLYPAGWIFPRMAMEDGVIGGVRIRAGSQLLITPYATHRLDGFWERPLEFDPDRFLPGKQERRHRYAYFPFGGGPHQCLGQHLFYVEAPLLVAAVLSRFRTAVRSPGPFTPARSASLRPEQKIELDLTEVVPVRRAS